MAEAAAHTWDYRIKSAELQDIRPPARRAGREKVRPP
nr:MAG TPA: hypothetical protein [Caudoviricetes sp.]